MTDNRVQAISCSLDTLKALLWQHDNTEKLKALVTLKQAWYENNHCEYWSDWIRDVFDPRTANAFGLAIWGRILNVTLVTDAAGDIEKKSFGFGVNHQNFGSGNFARDRDGTIGLTLEQQRLVVRLRYFQLTSKGTVPEINIFLKELFGEEGNVFVHDPLDMTYAVYFFSFEPDSQLALILEKYDLLPRPAGVGVKYIVQKRPSWGYEINHLNFTNGSFGA